MYRMWSLMTALWATTALTTGSVRKRFMFDPQVGMTTSSFFYQGGGPGNQGGMLAMTNGGSFSGPGGDPNHQGGLLIGSGPGGNPYLQGHGAVPSSGGGGGNSLPSSYLPTTPMTTTTTAVPVALSMTTTAPTSTSPDFCGVAKQLCTANCPGGYLVDPADCTFCICKKDALPG